MSRLLSLYIMQWWLFGLRFQVGSIALKNQGDTQAGLGGILGIAEERIEAKRAGWGMMELPVLRDCHGMIAAPHTLLSNCGLAIHTPLDLEGWQRKTCL